MSGDADRPLTAWRERANRFATSASDVVLRRLSDLVDVEDRPWMEAMRAELECIEGGWNRVRWALGGFPLVITLDWRRRMGAPHTTARNAAHPVILNALALAVGWLVVMGFARIGRPAFIGITASLIAACLIGVLIALALRARTAAVLAAGMVVNGVLELSVHILLGREAVQGAPAHFAVMIAATLGAALGAALYDPAGDLARAEPMWNSNDIFGSLRRVRRMRPVATLIFACVTAFVSSEALISLVYGWLPYRDRVTNVAVLVASVAGVALGALIGTYGSRLALQAISVRRVTNPALS